jgi:hypothetical protein
MKILIQMKTILTQTEIESQPNPLTNSASTCSKKCSLTCCIMGTIQEVQEEDHSCRNEYGTRALQSWWK